MTNQNDLHLTPANEVQTDVQPEPIVTPTGAPFAQDPLRVAPQLAARIAQAGNPAGQPQAAAPNITIIHQNH